MHVPSLLLCQVYASCHSLTFQHSQHERGSEGRHLSNPPACRAPLPAALLARCNQLQRLSCAGMSHLTTLAGLPPRALVVADLSGTSVADLAPLLSCAATLRQLCLSQVLPLGSRGGSDTPFAPVLQQLTNLQRLDLACCYLGAFVEDQGSLEQTLRELVDRTATLRGYL